MPVIEAGNDERKRSVPIWASVLPPSWLELLGRQYVVYGLVLYRATAGFERVGVFRTVFDSKDDEEYSWLRNLVQERIVLV